MLVIGLDGATWDIINPLMKEGRLPNIKALVDSGFASHLQTDVPSLSPIIWTTIATGKPPDQHGIKSFMLLDPKTGATVPYTSNMRRTKAFWNILSEEGLSCGVVGWWISWPAEEVNGVIVTSYSAVKVSNRLWKGTIFPDLEDQTYPQEFMKTVRPIIEDCERTVNSELQARIFSRVDTKKLKPIQNTVIDDTRNVFLADEIYSRTAEHLLRERKDLDVVSVYLSGTDVACHRFWKYYKPRGLPEFNTTQEEVRMLGSVIPDYYEHIDRIIGRLVAIDPDRSVVLISDHGFQAETRQGMGQNERSGGHEKKRLPGILLLSGEPFVRKNLTEKPGRSELPTIYDVLPSLLYLQELPTALDMPGRVLKEAFKKDVLLDRPVRSQDTYDLGAASSGAPVAPIASDLDRALQERLENLGYLMLQQQNEPQTGNQDQPLEKSDDEAESKKKKDD